MMSLWVSQRRASNKKKRRLTRRRWGSRRGDPLAEQQLSLHSPASAVSAARLRRVRRRTSSRTVKRCWEELPLLLPGARQLTCQLRQLQALRLSAVEDRLNDFRRQPRQPQQAVDEAAGDTLCFGQFPSASVRTLQASASTDAPAPVHGSTSR